MLTLPIDLKPKLLVLPLYTSSGPSSRYRSYNYLPYFEVAFDVDVEPLFSDDYYANRFSRAGRWGVLLESVKCYIRRFGVLWRADGYAVVYIEKQLFPFLPAFVERILLKRMQSVVFDFDDAVWHNYDQGNALLRWAFGRKLKKILSYGSLATAGCQYLESYTQQILPTIRIPTVVQQDAIVDAVIPSGKDPESSPFVVGWIGSPTTSEYIVAVVPYLAAAAAANDQLRFTFMGFNVNLEHHLESLPHTLVPWEQERENEWLASIDLGIMPLTDEPFARGKCGLKLIQYMGAGKVWAATALQTNIDLNATGVNYLVERPEDWVPVLARAFRERAAFPTAGAANLDYVSNCLSYEVMGPQLTDALLHVAHETTTV